MTLRGVVALTLVFTPWSLQNDWSMGRLGFWSFFSALTGAGLVGVFFFKPRVAYAWLYWNAIIAGPLYFLCLGIGALPVPRYPWVLVLSILAWLSIPMTIGRSRKDHEMYMERKVTQTLAAKETD